MDHTLVNPNQMRNFIIKVQDNPYDDSPLYLMTEDGDFALPLALQVTNIMADTRTPTEEELQACNHITLSSHHPWDPNRVRFPHPYRTVQEEVEMLRTIGAVIIGPMTKIAQNKMSFMTWIVSCTEQFPVYKSMQLHL